MTASHTSSQHNHAGSLSSGSAEKSPSNEKPSRDTRLEMFEKDDQDNLYSRLRDGESKSQTLEDKLGQHLSKVPGPTTTKH
ncbi:hypothetical protein CORC01_00333 [Colletotrichum orchidophilum]|uniref:Uncharacterized protein n=1 Tax=Colletotrichum orchidophilum TaxID=1209926 RepID=A0A1G4BSX3_9PEZI|nr:uncharacterized protein CORC01_00333 [Colletotrichum orchidophilum]OHF04481.1 hypothetical protein CORC01_00333 [Colletotrichum orchidophilum]